MLMAMAVSSTSIGREDMTDKELTEMMGAISGGMIVGLAIVTLMYIVMFCMGW